MKNSTSRKKTFDELMNLEKVINTKRNYYDKLSDIRIPLAIAIGNLDIDTIALSNVDTDIRLILRENIKDSINVDIDRYNSLITTMLEDNVK